MSTAGTHPQTPESEYELKKHELAQVLLADQSPVSEEAAFKRERIRYAELTKERKDMQRWIDRMRPVIDEVSTAETVFNDAERDLLSARGKLQELETKLGALAFAGLEAGSIPDHPRFADRKELHARILSLKLQRSSLQTGTGEGVVELATVKAQDLKLLGQLKIEELKVNSVNRAIGRDILAKGEEGTIRCDGTEQILVTIEKQRSRITRCQQAVRETAQKREETNQRASEAVGFPVQNAASLKSKMQHQETALRAATTSQTDIEEAVVEKALEYDWLMDNPELRDLLQRLAKLKTAATPRKLSVWPLAAVVIAGHLLSTLGSEPLNLSYLQVVVVYGLSVAFGLLLLSYYRPRVTTDDAPYTSIFILLVWSIGSLMLLFLIQDLAGYAAGTWGGQASGSGTGIFRLAQAVLASIGTAYHDTFAVMFDGETPTSYLKHFRDHMLSVGLCEEIVKITPALWALAVMREPWSARSRDFNSRLIYLAMLAGLAFGIGEGVLYHFQMYAPGQFAWGVYALRFLSCTTIHAVWAGTSGWILAHVSGGFVRQCFARWLGGLSPVLGMLTIAATVFVSDFLHTCHNLSQAPLWMVTWDVVSLWLFARLVACSSLAQLRKYAIFNIFSRRRPRLFDRGVNALSVPGLLAPNAAADERITSRTPPETPAVPELWNPNVAGFLSIIFTPVFGAWIHAQNWKALGQGVRAKESFLWFFASIGVVVAPLLFTINSPGVISLILLVAWWWRSGERQRKLVTSQYPNYKRKSWSTPLSVAGIILFGVIVTLTAIEMDSVSEEELQPDPSTGEFNVELGGMG